MKKWILLVGCLIYPSLGWSGIGDTYLCEDTVERLGGEGTPKSFTFVFKWKPTNISGTYHQNQSFIGQEIIFQNQTEFISTTYYQNGRITWVFDDSSLSKSNLLRTYIRDEYHFAKKSTCTKVDL